MKHINPVTVGANVTSVLESQDLEIEEAVLLVKGSWGIRTVNLYGGR